MATTRNFARDGVIDTISCGAGTDSLDADVIDLNLGGDWRDDQRGGGCPGRRRLSAADPRPIESPGWLFFALRERNSPR